jgi:4,5-DOPA dioxygenase extradiol
MIQADCHTLLSGHIMTSSLNAPVLFISHGAPTFAIEPGKLGPLLNALGQRLPPIRAILVVSPHWQTSGISVMTTIAPETIHDFGGFPPALYQLQYPVQGAPEIAREVGTLLTEAGWTVVLDDQRGLDHGAWVPLMHVLPGGDVPVFQVSMPHDLNPATAYTLGQALAAVRAHGVMILASGSMTHNLYEFKKLNSAPEKYAEEFTQWVRQAILRSDAQSMMAYRRLAPHAERAHPTDEHFLPLLVAMGATATGEPPELLDGGIEHGMLSMESYAWSGASGVTASA